MVWVKQVIAAVVPDYTIGAPTEVKSSIPRPSCTNEVQYGVHQSHPSSTRSELQVNLVVYTCKYFFGSVHVAQEGQPRTSEEAAHTVYFCIERGAYMASSEEEEAPHRQVRAACSRLEGREKCI